MRILIVEDDATEAVLLDMFMAARGYDTCVAKTGEQALALLNAEKFDLILLDVMLPGINGWQVLAEFRTRSQTPVLFVSAMSQQDDLIHGLSLGADDYVRKPVDLTELELRVAAVLRRSSAPPPASACLFDDGYLVVDFNRRQVTVNGAPAHLTPTEFRLLACLIENQHRALEHAELLRLVWGPAYGDDVANLQVYIRYLREKIEENPHRPCYIVTAWGLGYRFVSPR